MSESTNEARKIKVRREWVGAPQGTVANPTVWLFVATLATFAGVTAAYLTGRLPVLPTVLLNAVAIYVGFTVLHESMHGIAHTNRTVNRWLGRVTGMLLTVPFPLFRAVHYEHHSHTNDTERDPDLFIAESPRWLLPLWSLWILVEYRSHYYGRRLWREKADRNAALLSEAMLVAVIVIATAAGHLGTLLTVWIAPALLAVVFLVMAFDYLPHYPYDSAERYHDTRIYPGRLGNAIFLGQNYHLIHHLWTTIPWYRYTKVFPEIREDLEQRGARIGWRVEPSTASLREDRGARLA
jgi:beta-carotene hydroxylase